MIGAWQTVHRRVSSVAIGNTHDELERDTERRDFRRVCFRENSANELRDDMFFVVVGVRVRPDDKVDVGE
jgi:hypothetical protein